MTLKLIFMKNLDEINGSEKFWFALATVVQAYCFYKLFCWIDFNIDEDSKRKGLGQDTVFWFKSWVYISGLVMIACVNELIMLLFPNINWSLLKSLDICRQFLNKQLDKAFGN